MKKFHLIMLFGYCASVALCYAGKGRDKIHLDETLSKSPILLNANDYSTSGYPQQLVPRPVQHLIIGEPKSKDRHHRGQSEDYESRLRDILARESKKSKKSKRSKVERILEHIQDPLDERESLHSSGKTSHHKLHKSRKHRGNEIDQQQLIGLTTPSHLMNSAKQNKQYYNREANLPISSLSFGNVNNNKDKADQNIDSHLSPEERVSRFLQDKEALMAYQNLKAQMKYPPYSNKMSPHHRIKT